MTKLALHIHIHVDGVSLSLLQLCFSHLLYIITEIDQLFCVSCIVIINRLSE